MDLLPQAPNGSPEHPPEWFWAITCTIWLRLEFRGRGSAWFFSPHLLFVHAQGRIFEPRIGFWIPRSTLWPGDFVGEKWARKKTRFCDGMVLSWQFRGNSKTQMNSIVHRTHLGRLLCPEPPYLIIFKGFPIFRKTGERAETRPCISPIPLCGIPIPY